MMRYKPKLNGLSRVFLRI